MQDFVHQQYQVLETSIAGLASIGTWDPLGCETVRAGSMAVLSVLRICESNSCTKKLSWSARNRHLVSYIWLVAITALIFLVLPDKF